MPISKDQPFAGAITLAVDAADTARGIVSVNETIPVQAAGDLVLLYPQWETASHAPTVPLASLTGLEISIDGRRVEWRRDPVDVYAFHVTVPAGARSVTLGFKIIADRDTLHHDRIDLQWQRMLLYPAGWFTRDLPVSASLHVPAGMTAFTALDRIGPDAADLHFATTPLDRLVDAPVYAASISRQIELVSGGPQPVRLDLIAGDSTKLAMGESETARLRALIAQTGRVFGPAPFRHYDAIVVLDDKVGAGGIEHLEEGENDLPADYLLQPGKQLNNQDLIAHELVHAWNGRFRQPADLWTPTFNDPVGGSLLWVYEGQTEYWGRVLAARSGMRSRQETLDKLALDAATVANRPGRAWKSLTDSTNDAIYMAGHHVGWRDWQRREDYYPEGVLLWLDVDARLRELSGNQRSLDDFAKRFFHAARPDGVVSTYTFDDVCRTLDTIAHDDWHALLTRHLDTHDDSEATAGLARAGWRLVYTAVPSDTFLQNEAEAGGLDLDYSIGAIVDDEGVVDSVAWDSPAFRAGLSPGTRILTVDGTPYSREALRLATARSTAMIRLEISTDGERRSLGINYAGGLRYPHLERIAGSPDRLSALLMSR
ncbi:M61 family metallopeptidase [Sphingomonas abietis]|uniref:Peptidase M61 n=1 Tax=Sphingomonas abietis TaxID=3012344 RepID=A0ABY7NTW4_9SPHN|nr:peptidase M61 [Sphingomonas abietis]WBO22896.1 peptidase M61 [Sphingomonas abietis]